MSGSVTGPSTPNVFHVPVPVLPTYTPPDSYDPWQGTRVPLIIDNGACNLRFGFSTAGSKTALTPHSVSNVIAKFKERKYNQPLLLFGEGVDAESGAKGQTKTPWEGDVLLNFDALVRLSLFEVSIPALCLPELESRCFTSRTRCFMVRPRRTSELTCVYLAGTCT